MDGIAERRTFSARILAPSCRYVRETRGAPALAGAIARAPHAASRSAWLTHAEFEETLAGLRGTLDSDVEFLAACAHRLARSYGPVVHILRALSIDVYYQLLARTLRVVAKESRFEIAILGERRLMLRYFSPFRESRLMCLSRVAQLTKGPPALGLPPVALEERTCIARGDPCCDYRIGWEPR